MLSIHNHKDGSGDIECEASVTLYTLLRKMCELQPFSYAHLEIDTVFMKNITHFDILKFLNEPYREWFAEPDHAYILRHMNMKLQYAFREYNVHQKDLARSVRYKGWKESMQKTWLRFNMSTEHALDFKLRLGGAI